MLCKLIKSLFTPVYIAGDELVIRSLQGEHKSLSPATCVYTSELCPPCFYLCGRSPKLDRWGPKILLRTYTSEEKELRKAGRKHNSKTIHAGWFYVVVWSSVRVGQGQLSTAAWGLKFATYLHGNEQSSITTRFSFVFIMGRGLIVSMVLFGQCTENILDVMKFNAYPMLGVASYFLFIYLFCFGFWRQGHTL